MRFLVPVHKIYIGQLRIRLPGSTLGSILGSTQISFLHRPLRQGPLRVHYYTFLNTQGRMRLVTGPFCNFNYTLTQFLFHHRLSQTVMDPWMSLLDCTHKRILLWHVNHSVDPLLIVTWCVIGPCLIDSEVPYYCVFGMHNWTLMPV